MRYQLRHDRLAKVVASQVTKEQISRQQADKLISNKIDRYQDQYQNNIIVPKELSKKFFRQSPLKYIYNILDIYWNRSDFLLNKSEIQSVEPYISYLEKENSRQQISPQGFLKKSILKEEISRAISKIASICVGSLIIAIVVLAVRNQLHNIERINSQVNHLLDTADRMLEEESPILAFKLLMVADKINDHNDNFLLFDKKKESKQLKKALEDRLADIEFHLPDWNFQEVYSHGNGGDTTREWYIVNFTEKGGNLMAVLNLKENKMCLIKGVDLGQSERSYQFLNDDRSLAYITEDGQLAIVRINDDYESYEEIWTSGTVITDGIYKWNRKKELLAYLNDQNHLAIYSLKTHSNINPSFELAPSSYTNTDTTFNASFDWLPDGEHLICLAKGHELIIYHPFDDQVQTISKKIESCDTYIGSNSSTRRFDRSYKISSNDRYIAYIGNNYELGVYDWQKGSSLIATDQLGKSFKRGLRDSDRHQYLSSFIWQKEGEYLAYINNDNQLKIYDVKNDTSYLVEEALPPARRNHTNTKLVKDYQDSNQHSFLWSETSLELAYLTRINSDSAKNAMQLNVYNLQQDTAFVLGIVSPTSEHRVNDKGVYIDKYDYSYSYKWAKDSPLLAYVGHSDRLRLNSNRGQSSRSIATLYRDRQSNMCSNAFVWSADGMNLLIVNDNHEVGNYDIATNEVKIISSIAKEEEPTQVGDNNSINKYACGFADGYDQIYFLDDKGELCIHSLNCNSQIQITSDSTVQPKFYFQTANQIIVKEEAQQSDRSIIKSYDLQGNVLRSISHNTSSVEGIRINDKFIVSLSDSDTSPIPSLKLTNMSVPSERIKNYYYKLHSDQLTPQERQQFRIQ